MVPVSPSTNEARVVIKDDIYVLNVCARHLARDNEDARHDFGQYSPGDPRGRISEAWRFPLIDSYASGPDGDPEEDYAFNEVTFVYRRAPGPERSVAVVGTFADLWDPIALRSVAGTPYLTTTVVVPKGQVHTYRFLVDGEPILDPVNPQRSVLDNGRTWSRFFTQLCAIPLSLDERETSVLQALAGHLLPFRVDGGNKQEIQSLLRGYYRDLDRRPMHLRYLHAYLPDAAIGVVNFIDKLLAREESHHVVDYRICLSQIRELMRLRFPGTPPEAIPADGIALLFEQMQRGVVPGWDPDRYKEPAYFAKLLRRHVFTGAFSHPKYGGNAGVAGWAFLEKYFRDPVTNATLFDWRAAVEKPLGTSTSYRGFLGGPTASASEPGTRSGHE